MGKPNKSEPNTSERFTEDLLKQLKQIDECIKPGGSVDLIQLKEPTKQLKESVKILVELITTLEDLDDQHVEEKKGFFARIIQGFKNFVKKIKESIFGSSEKGEELTSVPNANIINKVEPENKRSQSMGESDSELVEKMKGVMRGSNITINKGGFSVQQKGKESSRSANSVPNVRGKKQGVSKK